MKKQQKFCIHKVPTNYRQEKNLNQQNTHEKRFWTHKIPTRKDFGIMNYPGERFWSHKIPTRKYFVPMKYTLTHDGTIWQETLKIHENADDTQPRKLALSLRNVSSSYAFLAYCDVTKTVYLKMNISFLYT